MTGSMHSLQLAYPLKDDGSKMILSFCQPAYLQGRFRSLSGEGHPRRYVHGTNPEAMYIPENRHGTQKLLVCRYSSSSKGSIFRWTMLVFGGEQKLRRLDAQDARQSRVCCPRYLATKPWMLPNVATKGTSWCLNQPIWKICSSNWIILPGRGENKKYLKPPPSGNVETPAEIHHFFAQISVLGRFVQVRSHLSMDFFQTKHQDLNISYIYIVVGY